MYKIHLECTKCWNVTWQYVQKNIDVQLDQMMDDIHHNLNKQLDALQKHERHNNSNKNTTKCTFHRRLVNLTNIKLVMIK